jgi:hypothetical protein
MTWNRASIGAAALLLTLGSSDAAAQWKKSGTRDVVICGGTFFFACSELSITTRFFSNTYSETSIAVRNLQGTHPLDTSAGTSILEFGAWATSNYFNGPSQHHPGLILNPNGAVRGSGGPAWSGSTWTRKGFWVTAPSRYGKQPPPLTGFLFETWGISGCRPVSVANTLPGLNGQYNFYEAFGTCAGSGYPGAVVVSMVHRQSSSPNFLDSFSFRLAGFNSSNAFRMYEGCDVRTAPNPYPGGNCEIVSDSYVGDTWNNPTVTPEPTSLLLLGTGVSVIGGMVARRRRHVERARSVA